MNRTFLTATCFAAAFALATVSGAQQPQEHQPQPQQHPQQQITAQPEMMATVEGCLQRGAEAGTYVLANARIIPDAQRAPVGTTGVEDRTDRPAEPGVDRPGTTREPQPGVGARAPETGVTDRDRDRDGMAYELVDAPEHVDLQDRVGQHVRVTGMFVPEREEDRDRAPVGTTGEPRPGVERQPDATYPGTQEAARDRQPGITADLDIAGHLKVQSVQQIAETCPPEWQEQPATPRTPPQQ